MKVKVLGISGTPVLGGNCDKLVQQALEAAHELPDVETEFITLADKEIASCTQCQYCIENRSPCKVHDDAHAIFDAMADSDGIIFGAPIWFETFAVPLLNLFSRGRYYAFFSDRYRNKAAGSITVGWFGYGAELALQSIEGLIRGLRMLPVDRGWAISSTAAFGQRAAYMEHGALDDRAGVSRVRNVGVRVVEIARIVKFAVEAGIALPEPLRRSAVGGAFGSSRQKVFVEGVWRDKES